MKDSFYWPPDRDKEMNAVCAGGMSSQFLEDWGIVSDSRLSLLAIEIRQEHLFHPLSSIGQSWCKSHIINILLLDSLIHSGNHRHCCWDLTPSSSQNGGTICPVFRALMHGLPQNWTKLCFASYVCHWCPWMIFLICHTWSFVQPGTGRRPVDWCRN